jgi:nicotinamidase-related amidase
MTEQDRIGDDDNSGGQQQQQSQDVAALPSLSSSPSVVVASQSTKSPVLSPSMIRKMKEMPTAESHSSKHEHHYEQYDDDNDNPRSLLAEESESRLHVNSSSLSTDDVTERQEQQYDPRSAMTTTEPHHSRGASFYEELKIKDGPLYSINAPPRNDSSEYLLRYAEQQEQTEADDPSTSFVVDGDGRPVQSHLDGGQRSSSKDTSFCSTTSSSSCGVDGAPFYRRNPLPAETTALLIVDVQPEYWSNCPAVRTDFPNFPQKLAKTIEICRRQRAKIIWVRADYRYSHSPWLSQFERIRGPRNLGEVPCDPSSPSFTSWEDFAHPQGGEVIIAKSSWSSTTNTALMDILRTGGIENVLVCGLITSVCVQHSAFGIFEAGYRTLLVTDACADRGRARHEAALALYGDYMYELVTSDDLDCDKTGLIPAQPVWLTLDAKTRMVRANSFPKPDDATVLSSSVAKTMRPTHPPPVVVHHHPHSNTSASTNTGVTPPRKHKQLVSLPGCSSISSSSSNSSSLFGMKVKPLKHCGSINSSTTTVTVCSSTTDEEEEESSSSSSSTASSSSSTTENVGIMM